MNLFGVIWRSKKFLATFATFCGKQFPHPMQRARNSSKLETRNPKPERLVPSLLHWFTQNARDLPWRRTRDPYAIWVSEIMLQQTQVKTVIPYWERWLRELPTLAALARARPAKIHKLWEGLGYYTRVRNLQKAARLIVAQHGGWFPDKFDDVLALPGVGRYTAGAICSIAFNQPAPILDGNVIRVLTRVFGIAENPRESRTNEHLWQLAGKLVRHASASAALRRGKSRTTHHAPRSTHHAPCSALNQSLMELGALICTPRSPQCPVCPIRTLCVAFREARVAELPNLRKRAAATQRRFAAFVVERNGRFLVRQRPAGVVNAQLWEFPNTELAGAGLRNATRTALGFTPTELKPLCTIRHSITRYRITLEAFVVKTAAPAAAGEGAPVSDPASASAPDRGSALPGGRWLTLRQLRRLSFPSAHRKILAHLRDASPV
jgi:A/G-specific adenine glycosylase